ncbi:Low specificity L-threonine aldolase [Roseovarius litorisediminis]|uniref:Low specificity L-threonine aldolase n=1 Tax=Roseovarius litorisediminis TaxID=1312363 RepID=A0A1Y5RTC2_9RHOB|nr:beta-eliminating lyase-related protein [Roseovarius litorisediminis]SLN24689.1 Low specificity L-threonine aldolase [Roseovarius litorisediminis]
MFFASDNTGPVHAEILAALSAANAGFSPSYGEDAMMTEVRNRVRDLFEAPMASVYLVATGTAANALALATLSQPWQTIFCTPLAHIHTDECNAPEFFTGGAKLSLVGGGDKMTPADLAAAIHSWTLGDVHVSQRGPLALTQVTEMGHVYTLDELATLTAIAADHDLPAYLDGARFANAVATLGCTPAEMTWKAGIDAVSMGGTKNGCLGVEAVIFFNPENAWEFELRRKRSAHLFSKHRYLSAQMLAYLTDDLWLRSAQSANANAAHLANGLRAMPGAQFLNDPQANMIFATLPRATHQRLHAAGAVYGLSGGPLDSGDADEPLACRLVCDWSISRDQIDRFVEIATT